jgi:uncharacterized protein
MWRDAHAHAITPPILDVLDGVLARTGPRAVLLERDQHFDSRAALDADLDALDARVAPAPLAPRRFSPAPSHPVDAAALQDAQHALLDSLLSGIDLPGFDPVHLAETRAILQGRKGCSSLPRTGAASRLATASCSSLVSRRT